MTALHLETARLRLRSFQPEDLDDLIRICSDPEAMRHIPPSYQPEPVAEVVARLARYQAHEAQHGYSFYHVSDHSGEFVGRAGFFWIAEVALFEVGYSLLPAHWGRGYATELTERLLDFAFAERGLRLVCGRTVPAHTRSRHVLEKTGFVFDSLRDFDVKGQPIEMAYYLREA